MGMMFGTQEKLICLEDVTLPGPSGESLCLAHKLSSKFFLAGVYVRDDGYVLAVKGQDRYYNMPTDAELTALQQQGALPARLPPHSIPAVELLFGYSLWIII